jgi:sugar/nucleoside kinase (ribokinase family)
MSASNSLPTRVLCAGILVADIFVPSLPSLPEAGELCATDDFLLDTGGCAANVATCLARLGVGSAVCGRVGEDVFGDIVLRDLVSKGVGVSGITRSIGSGTSKTIILPVSGEDRRYIHTFGANAEFSECDIDLGPLSKGDVLYFGGFLIMPSFTSSALAQLFRTAQLKGIKTVLDVVVPAEDGHSARHPIAEVLPFTDYFLPNDDEARALTGLADPFHQAKCFREQGCGNVLITRGNCGVVLMSSTMVLDAPAYDVKVVDGSGAGDAFAAGLITGLLEGREIADTLRFASAIGAFVCTRLGCGAGIPNRMEAQAFILQNPLEIRNR